MGTKTVYGIIGFDSSGNISALKGSGDWSVVRNKEGVYTVTFKDSVGFYDTPTVVLTEIYDGTKNNTDPSSNTDSGGNIGNVGTAAGAVLVWVRQTQFELAVGGGGGSKEDRMVSFMAIGSADD
jgi:hypothetical protein